MIIVAHPTGAVNARLVAQEFERAGMLQAFWTGLNVDPSHALIRHLPDGLLRHLRRRSYDLPQEKIRSFPLVESTMLALENLPGSPAATLSRYYRAAGMNRYFDWRVSRALHRSPAPVFYGFVGSCLQSARAAHLFGKLVVTEVTAVVESHQAIVREEATRNQDWAPTASLPSNDLSSHQLAYQAEVFRISDLLVVPSTFAVSSIPAQFRSKTRLANYPFPAGTVTSRPVTSARPLRIMFAGSLNQGKGLQYLSEALALLPFDFELTLVGSDNGGPCPALDALKARGRWIRTLPNAELKDLMGDHDVLVLPSLSDSFGLVVTEALSQGTPVIVSENTGAKDRVVEGENGFIVPIRDSRAIAERLNRLDRDRELLARMSDNALRLARQSASTPWLHEVTGWIEAAVARHAVPAEAVVA